ncbi:hypothetical protein CCACVL1_13702 [Corchorus capsularis]|uniref:ATP-dependent DNA helicase n=1 Tax=Corchorus capsularis TaxID=210143 RepID=A0A1R3I9Y6_COCAP|nr:hypothetical protein CCACVL1_13702 [Corchorus capsularis]
MIEGSGTVRVIDIRRLARSRDQISADYVVDPNGASTSTANATQGQQIQLQNQSTTIADGGQDLADLNGREIMVETISGRLLNVNDTVGYYDPLQYPLLFPCGTYGWDINSHDEYGNKLQCWQFYSYMLQIRPENPSLFLLVGRLMQQYVVDNFVKIEASRLRWYVNHQEEIRADCYQGLADSFIAGENSTTRLLPGQSPQDRPDLLTRIFHSKFEEFKVDIVTKGVLGRVVAYVYVIEFQKRGLPHAHMLVVVDEDSKLNTPDEYDRVVRAEIPNVEEEPQLFRAVTKHMIHGPCRSLNQHAQCMKDGKCNKNFPKPFAPVTIQGNDCYPIYRRRDVGAVQIGQRGNTYLDNSWVVPYNPWLLLKYDCHINLEIYSSVKCVKYLYKYVYKGPDRVAMDLRSASEHDEVQQFIDARWVCAPEALWRIFKFVLNRMYPSVERLQIHLPNMHQVRFNQNSTIADVLEDERNSKTMLIEYFHMNRVDPVARQYLYREFPEHYRWISSQRKWTKKEIVSEGYQKDLRTVNGIVYPTFKQAAERRGLLENDDSIRQCLLEAATFRMPSALRRLFVTLLVYCQASGERRLWEEFYPYMVEDYPSSSNNRNVHLKNRLLQDLNSLFIYHGKRLTNYDLPRISGNISYRNDMPKIIEDELSVHTPPEDLVAVQKLNTDQQHAYDKIISVVNQGKGGFFFIDGPGGTGKTFLYRTILATIRNEGLIVLATATSGIAATLLPGGRTTHSRFKLPLTPEASSVCFIDKQSDLAELIKRAAVIIWDEASMAHRRAFETLDRSLKDIMGNDTPFGGKAIVFGGDFRQTLPVGDGKEPVINNDMIQVPSLMAMPWEGDQSVDHLIESVFPNLNSHSHDRDYMVQRAILTLRNDEVDRLNEKIIKKFDGMEQIYYSIDSVEDDPHNLYQQEFLNGLSPNGLPPHVLTLKVGAPIMLLRNIDPKVGLCNGTRLICRGFLENVIDAQVMTDHFAGTRVFLHRIPMQPTINANLPFTMTRKQFPIRLSFALTINKSQGQTIPNVGIYLPNHVFSHGQLYVALSRGTSQSTTKVFFRVDAYFTSQKDQVNSQIHSVIDMQEDGIGIQTTLQPDNSVKQFRIMSFGWSKIVWADKTQLWNMVKREILAQKAEWNANVAKFEYDVTAEGRNYRRNQKLMPWFHKIPPYERYKNHIKEEIYIWKIELVDMCAQCITCKVTYSGKKFFLSAVYGANFENERKDLWNHLTHTAGIIGHEAWLVAGDFNIISNVEESSDYNVVENSWTQPISGRDPIIKLFCKLKRFKIVLRRFNKEKFGELSAKVCMKREEVAQLQVSILQSSSPQQSYILKTKELELKDFLAAEESFFKQKSRVQWVKEGDQNTKFFHKIVVVKKKSNTIKMLKSAADNTLNTFEQISDEAISFFKSLLGKKDNDVNGCSIEILAEILQDTVPEELKQALIDPVMPAEIQKTIFSMSGDKAPGPDGFNAHFFQTAWSLVKHDVIEAILYFFQTEIIYSSLVITQRSFGGKFFKLVDYIGLLAVGRLRGDLDALYSLIQADADVLGRIDQMKFVDTPLHIAAGAGNTDFAMEMMKLNPSFARILNPGGFSPIHLALQNQQNELVIDLLSVDKDLVRVKGREGYTPLHVVARDGNIPPLSQFLNGCPDSIFDLTIRKETALHIAAQNNRLEAFQAILKRIKKSLKYNLFQRKRILNSQDKDGNTVLHIAAMNDQPEVTFHFTFINLPK